MWRKERKKERKTDRQKVSKKEGRTDRQKDSKERK